MKRSILLLCALVLSVFCANAQIKVTGVVTDASDGSPIPFASIVVKNTSTGTAADADGKYSISVPNAKSVLVFSSIGYLTQEVENGGRAVINVMLATDAEAIDEVMVVAYGTTTKASFTGSAGKVDGERGAVALMPSPLAELLPLPFCAGCSPRHRFVVSRCRQCGSSAHTQYNSLLFGIAVHTVKQADTHCYCSDVKIFMLYHFIGLKDLMMCYHSYPSNVRCGAYC